MQPSTLQMQSRLFTMPSALCLTHQAGEEPAHRAQQVATSQVARQIVVFDLVQQMRISCTVRRHKRTGSLGRTQVVKGRPLLAARLAAALVVHVYHARLPVVAAEARGALARHVERRVLLAAGDAAAPRLDIHHALQAATQHAKPSPPELRESQLQVRLLNAGFQHGGLDALARHTDRRVYQQLAMQWRCGSTFFTTSGLQCVMSGH